MASRFHGKGGFVQLQNRQWMVICSRLSNMFFRDYESWLYECRSKVTMKVTENIFFVSGLSILTFTGVFI